MQIRNFHCFKKSTICDNERHFFITIFVTNEMCASESSEDEKCVVVWVLRGNIENLKDLNFLEECEGESYRFRRDFIDVVIGECRLNC